MARAHSWDWLDFLAPLAAGAGAAMMRGPRQQANAAFKEAQQQMLERQAANRPAGQGQAQGAAANPPVAQAQAPGSAIPGLSRAKYDIVFDVLNGTRPRSALSGLTPDELALVIRFYRAAGQEVRPGGAGNVLGNPDPIRRAIQAAYQSARADYLQNGGNFPGDFNAWVIRNYPANFIRNELPQVWEYMQRHPGLPRFGQ